LRVYQSCEYQGINFLDFLRGKDGDGAGGFGSGRRMPPIMDRVHTPNEQRGPDPEPPVGCDLAAPRPQP
jgi:hypothetical protein